MDLMHIWELKQEINKLLEERPELRPLQEELEAELRKVGSKENRAALAYSLMVSKLNELNELLKSCKSSEPCS